MDNIPRGKAPLVKRNTANGTVHMFCPECHEEIFQIDVEAYLHCPFCNCILQQNDEFDDFLLEGMVKNWISHSSQSAKG